MKYFHVGLGVPSNSSQFSFISGATCRSELSFLRYLILRYVVVGSSTLKKEVPPKSLYLFTKPHGTTSQKIITSNLRLTLVLVYRYFGAIPTDGRTSETYNCESWRSYGGDYVEYNLLGCDVVYCGRRLPTFRRNILLPTLGLKNKLRKHEPCLLAQLTHRRWSWRKYARSSGTPVNLYQTKWRHISEDITLHMHLIQAPSFIIIIITTVISIVDISIPQWLCVNSFKLIPIISQLKHN
jgi:hypothetical protein